MGDHLLLRGHRCYESVFFKEVMWDAGVLGFVVGILAELEKNMDLEIVYDHIDPV